MACLERGEASEVIGKAIGCISCLGAAAIVTSVAWALAIRAHLWVTLHVTGEPWSALLLMLAMLYAAWLVVKWLLKRKEKE